LQKCGKQAASHLQKNVCFLKILGISAALAGQLDRLLEQNVVEVTGGDEDAEQQDTHQK